MPTAIFVAGPTKIQVNLGAGFVDLGLTDNDSLPQITYTDNVHEIKTVASGAVPEEMVLQNTTAVISCTLVKWDAANLTALAVRERGAEYTTTVGRLLINGNGTFGVKILPLTAGKTSYTFATCMIMGDAINHSNFGNVEQRLGLTFKAIPTPSTNVLATSSTT
jgi:hypothetical protein